MSKILIWSFFSSVPKTILISLGIFFSGYVRVYKYNGLSWNQVGSDVNPSDTEVNYLSVPSPVDDSVTSYGSGAKKNFTMGDLINQALEENK